MKKITVTIFLLCLAGFSSIFATGKVYWQADGVLVTGIDGMGIGDLVTDMRGGAYIVTSDLYKVYLIRVDKNGNLPWGLSGITVDTNTYGAFQMNTLGVSDSCGGVIIVWDKFFPTGHRLYAQRVDSSGNNVWIAGGRLVSLSDSSQEEHVVVSDNQKGVIAAWQEYRNGEYDIYAQRLDSTGTRRWGSYGAAVCSAGGGQTEIQISQDDSGGIFISWRDWRETIGQTYLQRVNNAGTCLWVSNGMQLNPTDSLQGACPIVSDGLGNVICEWADKSLMDLDIYAQKINALGQCQWIGNVKVCIAESIQGGGAITTDKKFGVIGCWVDKRFNNYDIYAQRTDNLGNNLWLSNGVPICISDSTQWSQKIVSDTNSGAIICWQDKRSGVNHIYAQHVDSSGNVKWAINGMAVCTANPYGQEYPKIVASDSVTAIIAWNDGRSGWGRGYAQRVGDDPNGVEGTPNSELQIADCKLNQNQPNPFHQTTTINYQLTQSGLASLKIYNLAGQLVRTLDDGYRISGFYSVKWDGRDDKGQNVSNGIYFYSLSFNDRLATKKMILMK